MKAQKEMKTMVKDSKFKTQERFNPKDDKILGTDKKEVQQVNKFLKEVL